MNLLNDFMNIIDFKNYDDFSKNARINVVGEFNFAYDVVDKYACLAPQKKALVWCNSKGEEKILTFKEISLLSNKIANMLLSKGIKKGDFVMSMLNRRYEYYIFVVACMKIGVVFVPATYLLTPKDISYRINSAEIKALISIDEQEILTHISESLSACNHQPLLFTTSDQKGFMNFEKEYQNFPETLQNIEKPSTDDRMMMYFTSGTTGYPKMVVHNFRYPLGHIMTAKYWHNVQDDGLHFAMAESGWAKFSWGKIFGQWIAGSAVFCYDYFGKFTPTDILPLLGKYQITTFCAPPTIYRFLIKEDLSDVDFSSLKECSTAGEPLNGEVFKQFKKITGLEIKEGFGQTETCIILGNFLDQKIYPGSMGKPSPIYEINLLDLDDKIITDPDTEGEVTIKVQDKQIGLFCEYYKDKERTEKAFGSGFYHTGDLATRDKNGYYWFVGRKDDIIKSSGYRIGPFEVESALQEHPAVLECAITGAPDPLRGQVVKATIILAKGYEPSDTLKKEIQNYVKKATAPYKYPRIIEFVKELPKTVTGKIMRKDIRKTDE